MNPEIIQTVWLILVIVFIICGIMVHYKTQYMFIHYGLLISGIGLLAFAIV